MMMRKGNLGIMILPQVDDIASAFFLKFFQPDLPALDYLFLLIPLMMMNVYEGLNAQKFLFFF